MIFPRFDWSMPAGNVATEMIEVYGLRAKTSDKIGVHVPVTLAARYIR